jgi:hypothetical protein
MLRFEEPECPIEACSVDSYDSVAASVMQEFQQVVLRATSVASDNAGMEPGDRYTDVQRESRELGWWARVSGSRSSTPDSPRYEFVQLTIFCHQGLIEL